MSEEEKETIRNKRSNFALKRKLSTISTEDGTPQSCSDGAIPPQDGNSQNRQVQFADTASAGDQMNRCSRNLISQIRSSRCYTNNEGWLASSLCHSPSQDMQHVNAELDLHADTVVAGSACRVMEYTKHSCDVYPYSNNYEPISNVPVAKVITAYDHPTTGETFILVFGQALYMGDKMRHTLICPNHARANGVIINDVPIHLSHGRKSTHSIYFPNEQIRLPLHLKGVISYLSTCYPSDHCQWLTMTSDSPWDPYSDAFAEQEEIYVNHEIFSPQDKENRDIISLSSAIHSRICSINTDAREPLISDTQITKIFQCSPTVAANARRVTTQKGIRSVTHHLTWHSRTNQAALRYNQLGGRHGRFYSDTMFSSNLFTEIS
jgi:hypothetical protein